MKITSLHSRADLAKYLNRNTPQLACDFFIQIEDPKQLDSQHYALVTKFSFPDAGVSYNSIADAGHVTGDLNYGDKMTISYVASSASRSVIEDLFERQFYNGVPLFIPIDELPIIRIYRLQTPLTAASPSVVEAFRSDWGSLIEAISEAAANATAATTYNLISAGKELTPVEIMKLSGCRFTRPVPNIDLASDTAVTYTTTVSFEDFEY